MKTKVVNVHKEPYDVSIMRPSIYGNPFPLVGKDYVECVKKFREYFRQRISNENEIYLTEVLKLKGKRIGCCHDEKPCHGDVYVEFLEQEGEWAK